VPSGLEGQERRRRELVLEELDQGRATLIATRFDEASEEDRAVVAPILTV
jgi:hypothetical protein